MSDYDNVEKAVEKFVRGKNGARFEGRELISCIEANVKKSAPGAEKGPEGRELGELALDILASMDEKVLSDAGTGLFQSADGFFTGSLFRATPSKEEVEKGILLPFPRTAFFCNPALCGAEDIVIKPSDAKGFKKIGSVEKAMDFESVSASHVLVGKNALVDYLVAESNDNMAALKSGKRGAKMSFHVFDMKDYYKTVGFQPGDSLIFEVKDWTKGVFKFRREPERATEESRRAWMLAFERALAKTWTDFGDYLEVADQVASALFIDACSGGDLVHNPVVGLDEAHKLFKDVALTQNGGEWALVPSEELLEEADREDELLPPDAVKGLAPSDLSVSKSEAHSLDEMLKEINFPYPLPVFQALIYDELANGCESFDEFHSRHIAGLNLKPVDDAQEAAFLNFAEELWEDSSDRFNPHFDAQKAPLRTRVLETARACAETLAAIAAKTASEEKDKILEGYKGHHQGVVSLQRDIIETLALLNSDSPLPEGDEYDDLELRIGDMEELWENLSESLDPLAGRD